MKISYFIASKAYLLDSDREKDLPIPIFKSFSQLLEENLAFLISFCLILLISSLVFLFIKRKKKKRQDKTRQKRRQIQDKEEAKDEPKDRDGNKPKNKR